MSELVPPIKEGCAICAFAKQHAVTLVVIAVVVGYYWYKKQKDNESV